MLSARPSFDFYGFLNISLQQSVPINPFLTPIQELLFASRTQISTASAIPSGVISSSNGLPSLFTHLSHCFYMENLTKNQFTLASDSGAS